MKISLSFNNGAEGFILPINPPSIEIVSKHNNNKVQLVNLGEINLIGKRGLESLKIFSFFPSTKSAFYKRASMPASDYVSMIKKWKDSGKPIRVIITGMDFNAAMAIESFISTSSEGSGDIKYTLELSEYRFLNVETVSSPSVKPQAKNGLKPRPVEKKQPTTYTVKAGDTLWGIAQKMLGKGNDYPKIYGANQSSIDARNKNNKKYTIYVGQKLVIPK